MTDSTTIHPTADVETGVTVGRGTRIWARSHLRRGASVGSDCVIGENVFIDIDVQIGSRCKIQNNVSVYTGVVIEVTTNGTGYYETNIHELERSRNLTDGNCKEIFGLKSYGMRQ